jgi:hypothetical protein
MQYIAGCTQLHVMLVIVTGKHVPLQCDRHTIYAQAAILSSTFSWRSYTATCLTGKIVHAMPRAAQGDRHATSCMSHHISRPPVSNLAGLLIMPDIPSHWALSTTHTASEFVARQCFANIHNLPPIPTPPLDLITYLACCQLARVLAQAYLNPSQCVVLFLPAVVDHARSSSPSHRSCQVQRSLG